MDMNDKNDMNRKQGEDQDQAMISHVAYGISFGLLGGAAFSTFIGLFFDFPLIWAFGPGFGMMMGIVIGAVMDLNKNKDSLQ